MSWKIRTDALMTAFSSLARPHVSCRQRACIHGQMVNDQLANQNARFIQVVITRDVSSCRVRRHKFLNFTLSRHIVTNIDFTVDLFQQSIRFWLAYQ